MSADLTSSESLHCDNCSTQMGVCEFESYCMQVRKLRRRRKRLESTITRPHTEALQIFLQALKQSCAVAFSEWLRRNLYAKDEFSLQIQ